MATQTQESPAASRHRRALHLAIDPKNITKLKQIALLADVFKQFNIYLQHVSDVLQENSDDISGQKQWTPQKLQVDSKEIVAGRDSNHAQLWTSPALGIDIARLSNDVWRGIIEGGQTAQQTADVRKRLAHQFHTMDSKDKKNSRLLRYYANVPIQNAIGKVKGALGEVNDEKKGIIAQYNEKYGVAKRQLREAISTYGPHPDKPDDAKVLAYRRKNLAAAERMAIDRVLSKLKIAEFRINQAVQHLKNEAEQTARSISTSDSKPSEKPISATAAPTTATATRNPPNPNDPRDPLSNSPEPTADDRQAFEQRIQQLKNLGLPDKSALELGLSNSAVLAVAQLDKNKTDSLLEFYSSINDQRNNLDDPASEIVGKVATLSYPYPARKKDESNTQYRDRLKNESDAPAALLCAAVHHQAGLNGIRQQSIPYPWDYRGNDAMAESDLDNIYRNYSTGKIELSNALQQAGDRSREFVHFDGNTTDYGTTWEMFNNEVANQQNIPSS